MFRSSPARCRGGVFRVVQPRVFVIAAMVALLAACGPATSSSSSSDASKGSGRLDGHYTGTGSYVTGISFDVSDNGNTLTKFHGFITASCYTGGSLYSGTNHTVYNQYTMDDPESVSTDDHYDFTSTYTIPDTKGGFTFQGNLDGNGGATGTVSYKNGACASITAPWSASLDGVKRPPIPGASPSGQAQSDSCSPQPCATIANTVLTIQGFHTASGQDGSPMLELDFTLENTDENGSEGFADKLWLNDPSYGPVGPGVGIATVTLSSGEAVQCTHGVELQPGQTLSDLHWCYAQGKLDVSQPIRLDWISVKGTAHINLGTPD